MVNLQDAESLAVVLGLVASVAYILYQTLLGPWRERRETVKRAVSRLGADIRSTKQAAKKGSMAGAIGRLNAWKEDEDILPRKFRSDVGPFFDLTEEYSDAYDLAVKLVKLAIFEAVGNRPTLPRIPKSPLPGHASAVWIVRDVGSGSNTSRSSLEDALVYALMEPLLQSVSVRRSWIADHDAAFSGQLSESLGEATINELLEDVESRIGREERIGRPREIKAAIRDYRFRYLRTAA